MPEQSTSISRRALAESQDELGVEAGADELSRLVEGLVGQVDVVHGGDHVPRREPRPGGGRIHVDGDDLKAAVLLFQDSHSDAAVFIGGAELIGLVLVGRHVVAPLVAEARDHGGGGVVAEGAAVDGVDGGSSPPFFFFVLWVGPFKLVLAADGVEHARWVLEIDPPPTNSRARITYFSRMGILKMAEITARIAFSILCPDSWNTSDGCKSESAENRRLPGSHFRLSGIDRLISFCFFTRRRPAEMTSPE